MSIFNIHVKNLYKHTMTLQVKNNTRIKDIKRRIKDQFNIKETDQKLQCKWSYLEVDLESSKTIGHYKMKPLQTIHCLEIKNRINVNLREQDKIQVQHKMFVDPKMSVKQLKYAVQRLTGDPIDTQELYFKNKLLRDKMSLDDYGMTGNKRFNITLKRINPPPKKEQAIEKETTTGNQQHEKGGDDDNQAKEKTQEINSQGEDEDEEESVDEEDFDDDFDDD